MQLQLISTYNITYRRYRHRKDPVLTANRSATLTKSWNDHFLHIQIIHTDCNRKNIHNGIHCTHFMEMDLIHRYIMGFFFCLGKNLKNPFSIGFCTICHICMVDNLHDLVKATVFMVMVSVVGMHRFCICMTVSMGFLYMMFMRMGMLMGFQGFMTMLIMMFLMILAVRISIMPIQIFHIMIMILMIMIQ